MLVLSRKPGEKILIGDDITVTILRIGPNTVRVGIEAPQGINIVRQEVTIELGALTKRLNFLQVQRTQVAELLELAQGDPIAEPQLVGRLERIESQIQLVENDLAQDGAKDQ